MRQFGRGYGIENVIVQLALVGKLTYLRSRFVSVARGSWRVRHGSSVAVGR
jgi:hypothetical protein